MRHRKKKIMLSRKKDPRRALMKNLAESLILHERIETTEAKAKAIRPYVERLVTKGKANTLTARRQLISSLPTQRSVKKVMEVLSPKYQSREGGYTRIVKMASRKGDGAKMAIIEFV